MDPVTYEILRHRLWAINDEAATTIARISGSPIATEANDVNTALMRPDGQVVVTGIYVLVQVVSLHSVVADIQREYATNPGIGPGDMFLTNDPYVGAPHQPDVIVVAPIFAGDRLIAWSGSVVHQSDVGGPTAGSVDVAARSVFEEPTPIPPIRIVEGGTIRKDLEREYLRRSRTPSLNALDLLGQVAANRLQAQRVLALCDRYGTDAVVGTMAHLVDSVSARFRDRLAALPDGRWRHESYLEGDPVHPVRLTMTKLGSVLTLDFTESADQAPTGVNAALPTTQNFAMAAVMALLGWDLPWVPAAFWPAIRLGTREGSIVHARWPAATSMSVNAAAQEVRTCVNACVARLLDASSSLAGNVLAPGVSSAPAQTISGRTALGEPFGTMLLDGLLGGGGARAFADGADVCGMLTSPGAACANLEVVEQNYPVRYAYRRERVDSAGPGRFRGGVAGEVAYVPVAGPVDMTVFAHGVEQPTAAGVFGGEPGAPAGIAVAGRAVPPKVRMALDAGAEYHSWCAGGGGLGDPLDRPVADVLADVADGLVSPGSALADYGVPVSSPDTASFVRAQHRVARLGGLSPLPRTGTIAGRRLGSGLVLVDATVHCGHCGTALSPAAANVRRHLVMEELPVAARWPSVGSHAGSGRFVFRRYHCPGCATQLDTEVALAGRAPLHALEVML